MKMHYTKITPRIYKFFYEGEESYGEFYLRIDPEGVAELQAKDPIYKEPLLAAFEKALS